MRSSIRISALLVAATLFMPAVPAWACDKCFGAGVEAAGITAAMLSLIVMTGVIWGGIGAFFVNMRRRANELEPGDMFVTESGALQQPSNDA